MDKVNELKNMLQMGNDSASYEKRIDAAYSETKQAVQYGLIADAEALAMFKAKMGL